MKIYNKELHFKLNYFLLLVFTLLLIDILDNVVFASDDPNADLMAIQCLAERALNETNYKEAENMANFVVNTAFGRPNNWNKGNLLHHGFRIIGMVALKKGEIEEAEGHLLNSAVTHSGSPQLDSFGPNMSLAKALLQLGRK